MSKDKKPDARNRSRIAILSDIMSFGVKQMFKGSGRCLCFANDETSGYFIPQGFGSDKELFPDGSLVSVSFGNCDKYYLGWLLETKRDAGGYGKGDHIYTIESIEDGAICRWSNCSLIQYNPKRVEAHPQWRWTDKQWSFRDRWMNICYRKCDAYMVLPLLPDFHPDGAVTLGTRIRFGLGDAPVLKRFDNWKKVTAKMMLDYYQSAEKEFEKRPKKKPQSGTMLIDIGKDHVTVTEIKA